MSDDENEGVWRYCVVCMDEFISPTGHAQKCKDCRKGSMREGKHITVAEAQMKLQEAYRQGKIPQIESEDEEENYMAAEDEGDYSQDEILEMFGESDNWNDDEEYEF